VEARKENAKEKLSRVKDQIDVLRPKFIVPIASQVFFSHQENFYLNDEMNTMMDVADWVSRQTKSTPIVLYPGSMWEVGAPWDSQRDLSRYAVDYEAIAKQPRRTSESVSETDLIASHAKYISRLKKANNWALMRLISRLPFGLFSPLTIHLTDTGQTYRYSPFMGLIPAPGAAPDIEMSSPSLKFIFDFEWGFDTLGVNGRFRIRTSQTKVARAFFVGSLNNSGRGVNFRYPVISFLLRRVYWKWVTKMVRLPQGFSEGSA
jgi:hypothetical protein